MSCDLIELVSGFASSLYITAHLIISVTLFQTDALVRLLPLIGSSSIRYHKQNIFQFQRESTKHLFIFVHFFYHKFPQKAKDLSLIESKCINSAVTGIFED